MENDMRKELFSHLQTLSFSYYDTHSIGGIMSALTHDLLNPAELYHHGPEDYIVNGLRFFGVSAILFYLNARLALLLYSAHADCHNLLQPPYPPRFRTKSAKYQFRQ